MSEAKSGSNCLLASLIISESFSYGNSMSLSWILEMPLAPFLCHLPLVPCYSVKKSLTYSFSPALLETAKVLVFFLSLVFHVFGVLILLWLHTNAAGLPKGWKTAHIFAANLCYIHSWFLIGSICTSNDRVCKVPLQIKLVHAHHLVGGWQGRVRRCLQTIHAINLFPPKWLPINCFTLTKDGLQTLNIPCLRAKSGSNCLDLLHWSYLKVSLSCGNSMSLSWILEMPLAPFLCHLPLVPCYSVKKSLTYSFSPALLETAKVLVFLLSLVFHVFGVLILLRLHTNAAGLPKGWKTAHIFAHKDPHPATHFPTCRANW